MSRRVKSAILTTVHEFDWIVRKVSRKAPLAAKSKEPKLRKAVDMFNEKLGAMSPQLPLSGDIVIETNRNELRLLQAWIKTDLDALNGRVIPGYMERVNKDRAHYEKYLTASVAQAALLQGLLVKVERAL
jgi:hypothetical protein